MTANLVIETFPNEAATDYIRGKAIVDPQNFGALPSQLKQRAFTVANITQIDLLRKLRDIIAKLPQGAKWDDVKRELAAELSPFLMRGDGDESDGKKALKAAAQAEFLLKTNGFQAYAVSRHQQQMSTVRSHPYWMYETVGDDKVRPSHAALDGKVFRADDRFWKTHYPPWDYGCRCIVIALDQEDAQEIGISSGGDIPDAPARSGYRFDASNAGIDIDGLRKGRFKDDAEWQMFVDKAKGAKAERADGTECTIWDLCLENSRA